MKKLEAIRNLASVIILDDVSLNFQEAQDRAEDYIKLLEKMGMKPPGIAAKKIKGENYSWGSMCTMRCLCEDCDPSYIVNVWED